MNNRLFVLRLDAAFNRAKKAKPQGYEVILAIVSPGEAQD